MTGPADRLGEALAEIRRRGEVTATQARTFIAAASEGDPGSRLAWLSMARHQLGDDAVFATWVDLAEAEGQTEAPDLDLRWAMLEAVATRAEEGLLTAAQIDRLVAFLPGLVQAAQEGHLRELASRTMAGLGAASEAVGPALAEVYRTLGSPSARDRLIAALGPLRYRWAGIDDFYQSVLDELGPDVKPDVVAFLLGRGLLEDQRQRKLLAAAEPDQVRHAVLRYANDRTDQPSDPLSAAIVASATADRSVPCRRAALAFAETRITDPAALVGILLEVLRHDPDETMREQAQSALGRSGLIDAGTVAQIEAVLGEAADAAMFTALWNVLHPYAGAPGGVGEAVRSAAFSLLDRNLDTDAVAFLCQSLGVVIARLPELADDVLTRLDAVGDGRVRAAFIETLARRAPGKGEAALAIATRYAEACRSGSPTLRNAGLAGLLALPLTDELIPAVLAGIDLIADPDVDPQRRMRLAWKLARVPSFSGEEERRLRTLLDGMRSSAMAHGSGGVIDALEEALNRNRDRAGGAGAPGDSAPDDSAPGDSAPGDSPDDSAPPRYDLARWRSRLHDDGELDGVFPDIYLAYEERPEEAADLLREIAKAPEPYPPPLTADHPAVLSFLAAWGEVDDEMSRLAVDFLMTKDERHGDPNFYLGLLKSNPAYPDLAADLWRVFERGGVHPSLLWEVLVIAHGGEETLADALAQRATAKTSEQQLAPYLAFLAAQADWAQCPRLVSALSELVEDQPDLGRQGNADLLTQLRAALHLEAVRPGRSPKRTQKPGLLDD